MRSFFMQKNKILRYICMRVLKPTTDEQTFFIIPREYAISNVIELRDDQTNTTTSYTTTMVKENDYLKFTGVFTLLEGHFYDLTLTSVAGRKYNADKIFCTAQTINQNNNEEYSVNKDLYITNDSYSNDYIVL
tara:strand:- start:173 stop:571 length:399 start_codon:yes stop_codon:yes gene_type:complete